MAETYLGLRHGPMSFVHDDTLVVCFLSSAMPARAYEIDLIRELNAKHLGCGKVIVGEAVPRGARSTRLSARGSARRVTTLAAVVHIVAGQLLALFRSMAEGLRPDAPSSGQRHHPRCAGIPDPPMKILVIGEINPDLILQQLRSIPGSRPRGAGGGHVAGRSAARPASARRGWPGWDHEVAMLGKVGRDPWGDFCLERLRALGRRYQPGACAMPAVKTGITVSDFRAARSRAGDVSGSDRALLGARFRHALSTAFGTCTFRAYYMQHGLRPDARNCSPTAHATGLTTSLDPGYDPAERWDGGLRDTLVETDVFLPNEVELAAITAETADRGGAAQRSPTAAR